jgi:hypothetical protein
MNLKKVQGKDFQTHEEGNTDGKLPQMIVRDGSLKANVEREVKSQCKKNCIRPQKKYNSLQRTSLQKVVKQRIQKRLHISE